MSGFLRVEQVIDAMVDARPDKVALICGERRWTFRELRDEVDRRAGVLVDAGLRSGEHAVTAERSSDDYLITFLACCRAGLALAMLSPLLTATELAGLTERIAPGVAFTANGEPLAGLAARQTLPLGLPGTPTAAGLVEAARRSAAGSAEDPAILRATSGTSGSLPKLALHPHRSVTWRYELVHWWDSPEAVYCYPNANLPMLGEMCHALGLGARVIVPVGTPHDLEAQLAEHGVTVICTSPALMGLLAQQTAPSLPGLRLAVIRTTAAALDPDLKRALEARYGALVLQEFGQSECLTILRPASPQVPASSVGQPPPGVEIRLIDSAGRDVPDGALGELIVRSPGMMLGYLGDPEATVAALRDDWLHTGDNARRDADGCYYLAGRRGLLINVAGHKVAPEEIEAVLEQHPGVREAVVVPQPDALRGEVVRAIVVPEGMAPAEQELRRFCRARLAGYKVPRSIKFRREPLPRSALGKVLRQRL